jgi:hypothetical protein
LNSLAKSNKDTAQILDKDENNSNMQNEECSKTGGETSKGDGIIKLASNLSTNH